MHKQAVLFYVDGVAAADVRRGLYRFFIILNRLEHLARCKVHRRGAHDVEDAQSGYLPYVCHLPMCVCVYLSVITAMLCCAGCASASWRHSKLGLKGHNIYPNKRNNNKTDLRN